MSDLQDLMLDVPHRGGQRTCVGFPCPLCQYGESDLLLQEKTASGYVLHLRCRFCAEQFPVEV